MLAHLRRESLCTQQTVAASRGLARSGRRQKPPGAHCWPYLPALPVAVRSQARAEHRLAPHIRLILERVSEGGHSWAEAGHAGCRPAGRAACSCRCLPAYACTPSALAAPQLKAAPAVKSHGAPCSSGARLPLYSGTRSAQSTPPALSPKGSPVLGPPAPPQFDGLRSGLPPGCRPAQAAPADSTLCQGKSALVSAQLGAVPSCEGRE